jgi:SAM-dependent methyltransferase
MAPERDSVQRFTDRVDDYARFRPGYPDDIVSIATGNLGLRSGAAIADVGSGTGKSSLPFLRAGFEVHAVEPNPRMRAAAETELAAWTSFHSLDGVAEDLPLEDGSVALVVAGQAFHWFDQAVARKEFQRVLVGDGGLMLLWNNRRTESSRFLVDYEKMLLDHCPDYVNVGNRHYEDIELEEFFGGPFRSARLQTQQTLDAVGFQGRLFSSSYTPGSGEERRALEEASRRLFDRHAVAGKVHIDYDTEVFYGHLAPDPPDPPDRNTGQRG